MVLVSISAFSNNADNLEADMKAFTASILQHGCAGSHGTVVRVNGKRITVIGRVPSANSKQLSSFIEINFTLLIRLL